MRLEKLSEILERARERESRRLVVAAAEDLNVLQAVLRAKSENIIKPLLVGDTSKILAICREHQLDLEDIPLIEEKDPARACVLAIELIRAGEADILMKGLVSTTPLLKAVLDKEKGLRKSSVLSHAALFEISSYHKLLAITDAAMNVAPGVPEKINIIENAVEIFHRLGIADPKVAVLAPVEIVNPKIQSTVDAEELKKLNETGKIKGCIIDGPLAMDIAVSSEARDHKGITSTVAGDPDILLTPDLNCGNILYKSLIFLGGSTSAAVVMGAQVPIVLTSRADSNRSKLMSIALASALD
ncbi:bifunctional enoyl-CoA hydratase/phosphate acetyltransferase [Bacteroidota bacterium]